MKKYKSNLIKPVVKWVGGKRQLLDEIKRLVPKDYTTYCEPFLGGAAVLFELQPDKAIINDYNSELINVYQTIKDDPVNLIQNLEMHKENNSSDYFYSIREVDRNPNVFMQYSNVQRAARIIYLNKTCFNGLFRVNMAGQFNTPYGKYKNPNIVNSISINAVSKYFSTNEVLILNGDFSVALQNLEADSFVYMDPPYMPISETSSFTGYTQGGFDAEQQQRLKLECDRLNANGIKFLQSNSDCQFIRDLYADYTIETVSAKRSINSDSTKRGEINEVLIYNYNI